MILDQEIVMEEQSAEMRDFEYHKIKLKDKVLYCFFTVV